MGNTNSGLPYDEGAKLEYASHWALSEGTKRTPEADKVCILKFDKTQKDKKDIAMRNFSKMRTLKHPGCLPYLDGVDLETALVIVTEPCVSLEAWMNARLAEKDDRSLGRTSADFNTSITQEITWGIKCILNALHFLHTANMAHGYLSPNAIFVMPNGDWKLGAFELTCNLSIPEDESFFKRSNMYLGNPYLSPERTNIDRGDILFRNAFGVVDIWALAQCIESIYGTFQMPVPPAYGKYMDKMSSVEFRKRPSAKQLLACALFTTEYIKLLESLGENALNSLQDAANTMGNVMSHITSIPPFLCVYKVLPTIVQSLSMCIRDFQQRDAREACRQTISLALGLLASMVEQNKISEKEYTEKCLPGQVQLWSMSDRSVRTSLLRTSRTLIGFTPNKVVNEHIFDPMLAGFADSNMGMREDTLKNLVHVVDKLEGKHMLDKLVRCIVNLQNDTEPSLRTNATIFLGKIATKLEDSVRQRIVYPAFVKAMKDPFLHCRLAGLKASMACIQLVDLVSLVNRMLPQVGILAMDSHPDVRELALSVVQAGVEMLQENHQRMKEQKPPPQQQQAEGARQQRDTGSPRPTAAAAPNSGGFSSIGSSWVASLVPQIASMDAAATATASSTRGDAESSSAGAHMNAKSAVLTAAAAAAAVEDPPEEEEENEGDGWESGDEYDTAPFKKGMLSISNTKARRTSSTSGGGGGGWGNDDLDDFDLDEGIKPRVLKVSKLGVKKEKVEESKASESSGSGTGGFSTKSKVASSKDSGGGGVGADAGWDDFDDMNLDADSPPAKPAANSSSMAISVKREDFVRKPRIPKAEKAEKAEKAVVTKMAASGWDDDDDWGTPAPAPAPAPAPVPAPAASPTRVVQGMKLGGASKPAGGLGRGASSSASSGSSSTSSSSTNNDFCSGTSSPISPSPIKSSVSASAPVVAPQPKGMLLKGKVAKLKVKKDEASGWEDF